jgi:hypothetical protein
MTVSFYMETDDLYQLDLYLESYDEEEENPTLYYSNTPTSPTTLLVTIDFYQFNELIDLDLLQLI